MFDLIFYRDTNNKCPMEEFLDSLRPQMAKKALLELKLLEEKGYELREPHTKAIGDGLFELRIKVSSDIARSFFFFSFGNTIIVTNGFLKKTARTPKREIKRAQKLMADWKERFIHE